MNQNQFHRFDILEAHIENMETDHFLILDGEIGLQRAKEIIVAPLFLEKVPRFQLYIDCVVEGQTYLAAIDGVMPIPRSSLVQDTPLAHLNDEKTQQIIAQTFTLMLNM